MPEYRYTDYFEKQVLRKRPTLKKGWCVYVLEHAVHCKPQEQSRFRYWAPIEDLGGPYLRVITLDDQTTIHNAFPDQDFKP